MKSGNSLSSLQTESAVNIELEVMKNSLYRFHDCLQNLNKLEESFKLDESYLKFTPSEWIPTITNFGDFFENQKFDTQDLNMNNILDVNLNCNAIHLNCGIKNISKMSNLSDKRLVLLSNEDSKNELTIIDENFACIRYYSHLEFINFFVLVKLLNFSRLSSIGSRKFKQLVSLCSDDFENVYLADAGASQLLILDNEFSFIKRTIGKKGTKNGEFNGLIDICFFDGRLYALDKCKRVQIFSKQGDFIRSNKLYRNNSNEEDDSDSVKNKRASKISSNVENFIEHPISLKGNF
jgi:hypothetical protein